MKKLISYLLSTIFILVLGCTVICSSTASAYEIQYDLASSYQSVSDHHEHPPCDNSHEIACNEDLKLNVVNRNKFVENKKHFRIRDYIALNRELNSYIQQFISRKPSSCFQNTPLKQQFQTEVLLL